MADNFNMKKYLAENKLGAYSRIKEDIGKDIEDTEAMKQMDFLAEKEAGQGNLMIINRVEEIVNNLARNISTNSNIPTQEKLGLVQALKELKDLVEDLGADAEQEYEEEQSISINEGEYLSPDGFDRASGLVKTESIRKMLEAAEDMMEDLTAEGFEIEEIREFFTQLISNDI